MKKIKTLLATLSAAAMLLCCVPVFAAEAPMQAKNDVPLSQVRGNAEIAQSSEVAAAAEYAYMDIDSATPAMQEKILEARNTIIFSQSWTNLAEYDGVTVKAIDIKTNTTYDLPDFYDLFPDDWEVPSADCMPIDVEDCELAAEADYAYMNVDSATPAMKEKILAARNAIIFSRGWTNLADYDGVTAGVIDFNTNTKQELPDFYDIFPADWEVPSSVDGNENVTNEVAVPNSVANFYLLRRFPNLALSAPPSTGNTPSFYNFTSTGLNYAVYAESLPGATWNCGFSNANGVSIAYRTNMSAGEGLYLAGSASGSSWGIRASTYSTPGSADIRFGYYI